MSPLSVIIPCYNCAKTLEEAVRSVFSQGLMEFEIVMVDDLSTDDTYSKMKELAVAHPEIRIFQNPKNLGGGATRNNAVGFASHDLIFCLDSDDVLGENLLPKLASFWEEKKCDAVTYSSNVKFQNDNLNDNPYTSNFGYVNQIIPIRSLFERDTCGLYSVCLFTKKAHEVMGGYPEGHGFDTQGFAFRFLLNGLIAYTCPDTIYYQRTNSGTSYYMREYESGRMNHNWYKVFEEFLFMFDESTQRKILEADLNNPTYSLFEDIQGSPDIFKKEYAKFIVPKSGARYAAEHALSDNPFDTYWLALTAFNAADFEKAQSLFESSVRNFPKCGYAQYYLEKCVEHTARPSSYAKPDMVQRLFSYKKRGKAASLHVRIFRKLGKLLS